MNDFFNLDDLTDRETGSHFGGLIGAIVRLLLALTTAGFFFTYGELLFEWLVGPEYAGWTAAAIGTFAIDGMAYVWPRLRESSATTETQMTAAAIGTVGNMGISVLITVIFIVLRTTWVSLTDASGQLTAAGWAINLLGLTVMTLGIAGNGALVAYYEYNSAQARERRGKVSMDALKNQAAHKLLEAQMRMTIERTLQDVGNQLPDVAQRAGQHNSDRFLRGQFGYLDDAVRHDMARPPMQARAGQGSNTNGRGPGSASGGDANFR